MAMAVEIFGQSMIEAGRQETQQAAARAARELRQHAMDRETVRDILGGQTITRIPLAPPEVAGSLNLRGRIDLRRRQRLAPSPPGVPRMSVVTELDGELYARVVDQVSGAMSLKADAFEPNPSTLPARWAHFSTGVYRLDANNCWWCPTWPPARVSNPG